ncbi:MAG: class D sortase [Ruminococcus sp.]
MLLQVQAFGRKKKEMHDCHCNSTDKKLKKRQILMFIAGLLAILIGLSVLSVFACRKIRRELNLNKLMQENVVVEIPDLDIKAPVLDGIDNDTLRQAAGHFENTGDVGEGNYCIAGHSSVIYEEFFNDLKNVQLGMKIYLYDKSKNLCTYVVTDSFIVDPNETWILDDFEDVRVTIVTCTDDGTQRQVVIGKLHSND